VHQVGAISCNIILPPMSSIFQTVLFLSSYTTKTLYALCTSPLPPPHVASLHRSVFEQHIHTKQHYASFR